MARHFFVGRREGGGLFCLRCGGGWDDEVHLEPATDRDAVVFRGWYVRTPREREELGLPTRILTELSERAQRRAERTSEWRREFALAFAERVREEEAREVRSAVRRRRQRTGSSPK